MRHQPELAGHFLAQLTQRGDLALGSLAVLFSGQTRLGQLALHQPQPLAFTVQRIGQPVAFFDQFGQTLYQRLSPGFKPAGGQLLFACDTVAAALPLIRGGMLRALAVSAPQQLSTLPGVPTGAQAGMPSFQLSAWWGLVAPAGTPPAVVALLSDAVLKALAAPQVRQTLDAQQLEPLPLGATAFGALMHDEAPFWAGFVRRSGIRLDS